MRGARVVAGVVAVAGLTLGCGTEPPRLAGTYFLRSIDGVALPITLETPYWGTTRWVNGSMIILAAERFRLELDADVTRNGVAVRGDTLVYPEWGTLYRWVAPDQVEFYMCCRPNSTGFFGSGDTIHVGTGVIEHDTLRLTAAGMFDPAPHVLRFTH